MSNYKIRVSSEAESKEAQELFFELGFQWRGLKSPFDLFYPTSMDNYYILLTKGSKEMQIAGAFRDGLRAWKEITLQQLREMVKPMKEYLRKNSNDTYSYIGMVQPENISQNVIEIPEGSETFNYYDRKDNLFFLKGAGENALFSNDLNDWEWKEWGDIDFDGVVCLWSRSTHPEELPFIDDEPLQSLNDQYAEIEKVRQSAWQKQEGGSHYKNLKIQPMQYALENKLDYAQANVVKYVTRHKEKNGKEDLLKAIHNIELMIEFYYGGGE